MSANSNDDVDNSDNGDGDDGDDGGRPNRGNRNDGLHRDSSFARSFFDAGASHPALSYTSSVAIVAPPPPPSSQQHAVATTSSIGGIVSASASSNTGSRRIPRSRPPPRGRDNSDNDNNSDHEEQQLCEPLSGTSGRRNECDRYDPDRQYLEEGGVNSRNSIPNEVNVETATMLSDDVPVPRSRPVGRRASSKRLSSLRNRYGNSSNNNNNQLRQQRFSDLTFDDDGRSRGSGSAGTPTPPPPDNDNDSRSRNDSQDEKEEEEEAKSTSSSCPPPPLPVLEARQESWYRDALGQAGMTEECLDAMLLLGSGTAAATATEGGDAGAGAGTGGTGGSRSGLLLQPSSSGLISSTSLSQVVVSGTVAAATTAAQPVAVRRGTSQFNDDEVLAQYRIMAQHEARQLAKERLGVDDVRELDPRRKKKQHSSSAVAGSNSYEDGDRLRSSLLLADIELNCPPPIIVDSRTDAMMRQNQEAIRSRLLLKSSTKKSLPPTDPASLPSILVGNYNKRDKLRRLHHRPRCDEPQLQVGQVVAVPDGDDGGGDDVAGGAGPTSQRNDGGSGGEEGGPTSLLLAKKNPASAFVLCLGCRRGLAVSRYATLVQCPGCGTASPVVSTALSMFPSSSSPSSPPLPADAAVGVPAAVSSSLTG